MIVCQICNKLFSRLEEFQVHIKYIHNIGSGNFKGAVCPYQNCLSEQNTWSGYLRHLKSHNLNIDNNETVEISDDCIELGVDEIYNNAEIGTTDEIDEGTEVENLNEDVSVDAGIKIMIDILSSFCSSLLAKGVTNSTVDFVVQELKFSFAQVISLVLNLGRKFCEAGFEEFSCLTQGLRGTIFINKIILSKTKII